MVRVDYVIVEALQLKISWALIVDAKSLRGKILGGEVFGLFGQQERE